MNNELTLIKRIEILESIEDNLAKGKEKEWVIRLLNNGCMLDNIVYMANVQKQYPAEVIWIKDNKDILNLKSVADKTGIPAKNLWNYCHDVHSLNEKWFHGW